jgi:diguanylate cyclase (GGDEF)-like protein
MDQVMHLQGGTLEAVDLSHGPDSKSRGVAPLPANEAQRIQSLCALGLLDTPAHERFDRLTRLATRLFDVPIALVSLVDTDRQWFKSKVGISAPQTPREESFCAHAILTDEVLLVSDASADERFRSNPLVLGSPNIRFYAGCPIKAPDGHALGTLCVIDSKPRTLGSDDAQLLRDLAEMVEQEIKAVALATVDELTGLTNRRGLDAVARHILGFCDRVARPASLLLFDLDGFKQVNDTVGHAAGDRVLQGFAEALLATFRDCDVVARLGGDEFCVVMSGASEDDARRPLGALSKRMAKCVGPHAVSFSVGVTTYDRHLHADFADLLGEADRKMYQQKREAFPRL